MDGSSHVPASPLGPRLERAAAYRVRDRVMVEDYLRLCALERRGIDVESDLNGVIAAAEEFDASVGRGAAFASDSHVAGWLRTAAEWRRTDGLRSADKHAPAADSLDALAESPTSVGYQVPADAGRSTEDIVLAELDWQERRRALDALSDRDQQILELRMAHRTNRQVAAELGIPEMIATKATSRIRERLGLAPVRRRKRHA